MTFGLTPEGFVIKRQPDIIADLEERFKNAFGNINVDAASVFGQIIGVQSKPLIDLWELAQLVYLSQYANSAEGKSLDDVSLLVGVSRLESTESTVTGVLIGDEGTVVPAGTQASIVNTTNGFETVEEITINKLSLLKATIGVANVLDLTLYNVTINGIQYGMTSDADATAEEIAAGLVVEINSGQSDVDATDNGDGTLTLISADLVTEFSADVDVNLQFDNLGTPVGFIALEKGSIPVPANTLTVIDTPVSGLDEVINLTAGTTGRDVETDAELRARRKLSLRIAGAGTVEAIKARIAQEVDGVTLSRVYENRENYYQTTITVSVDTAEDTSDYTVYINGIAFMIISDGSATIEEIATALVNSINAGSLSVTATDNLDGTFNVVGSVAGIIHSFFVDPRLSITQGRPPHSFECVVVGGDDQDIVDKIWLVKPAGIEAWGNTPGIVVDSEGNNQPISFSRPVPKYAWIYVDLTLNDEEIFPADGEDQVAENILEKGNTFEIGDDLIIQKFFGPIYQVPGIGNADISVALTDDPGDPPSYVFTNLPIGEVEVAVFDLARITINII